MAQIRFKISKMLKKLLNSAVLTSWMSLFIKLCGVALILPLLVVKLSAEEVVIWYIFTTITTLITILDFGFSPTLSRLFGYANGGASITDIAGNSFKNKKSEVANLNSVFELRHFCSKAYILLALGSGVLIAILGTLALNLPVSNSHLGNEIWFAWILVIVASSLQLYSMRYSIELQGSNRISDIQIRQSTTAFLSLTCASTALLLEKSLPIVVACYYIWPLVYFARIRFRWNQVLPQSNAFTAKQTKLVWGFAWHAIWKSGIGLLMSVGIIQTSGIVYAQLAPAGEVAAYMIGLQLIRAISQFSQVPFYVKLPVYSSQYANGLKQAVINNASQSMRLAYLVFTVGFVFVAFAGDIVFDFIGSDVNLPSSLVWALMGCAVLIERYGAMHIQLYSLSNNIIWHIANGGTGLLMITMATLLYPHLGGVAFPLSMLLAYLLFYSWYSAKHSYKEFALTFYKFELTVFIPYLVAFSTWLLFVIYKNNIRGF